MVNARCRTICWTPTWNKDHDGMGMEHFLLSESLADSIVLAFDEEHGPFRLTYHLTWDESWRLRRAELVAATERFSRSLSLQTDGHGHWQHSDGRAIEELDGCVDVDIWPPLSPTASRFAASNWLSVSGGNSAWRGSSRPT